MIFLHWKLFLGSCIFTPIILIWIALFSYRVNSDREPDDPKKKDFHQKSPWLAPLAPIVWLGRYLILAPWSIPFFIFLITFPFVLIIFRPLSPDDPLNRLILKFGNSMLKINTWILNSLGMRQTQAIKLLNFE